VFAFSGNSSRSPNPQDLILVPGIASMSKGACVLKVLSRTIYTPPYVFLRQPMEN